MITPEMTPEVAAYEIEDLWNPQNLHASDIERVEFLFNRIPKDARTVLDVGSGGGVFVNYLQMHAKHLKRLCAVDRSKAALKYVLTEKFNAEIASLPFDKGEFDLVACLEVIEHLPIRTYERAIAELCRVSARYVLLCVPNDQDLESSLVKCPLCCSRYNPDGHLRSFTYDRLANMFVRYGFSCQERYFVHKARQYVGLSWVLSLRRVAEKGLPWYAVCPVCGFQSGGTPTVRQAGGGVQPARDNRFRRLAKRLWPKTFQYRWIAALYTRMDGKVT